MSALNPECQSVWLADRPAPSASNPYLDLTPIMAPQERRTVPHPSGNFFQSAALPLNDPVATMLQINSNISSFMWDSVVEGSRRTYQSGYNHHLAFCQFLGTDSMIQTVPPAFLQLPQPSPHSWLVTYFMGLLSYLRLNKNLQPGTINTYISGVRFFLKNQNVDLSELDTSPIVKTCRSGMLKSWRALPGNSQADAVTLPFAADTIVLGRSYFFNYDDPIHQTKLDIATSTALVFAFVLLARISEYLVTKSNHHILGRDITFVFRLADGSSIMIDSSQAHNHNVDNLIEMYATIRDSKNDPDGTGHRFCYQKRTVSSTALFCVATEMFRCASVLRPSPTSAFFAFRGDTLDPNAWSLTQHNFNAAIRLIASHQGWNPKHFSSHSLRIGGASALAAGGAPSWQIQLIGRWSSLAFLQYIRLASSAFQSAIALQTDGVTFTSAHIAQWHPGMASIPCSVVNSGF